MVKLELDAKRGLKRLEKFKKLVGELGKARCELTPSHVLYLHCQRLNSGPKDSLLNRMPASVRRDIERRWRPKVEAAAKKTFKDEKLRNETIARAWRFGAYVHADKLWAAAKRGAWGQVDPATVPVKRAALAGDRARNAAARKPRGPSVPSGPKGPRKPRAPRSPSSRGFMRGRGSGADVSSYGVRAQERGRQWYNIQKGRAKHGRRTEGELSQSTPVIEIFIGHRRIDSR